MGNIIAWIQTHRVTYWGLIVFLYLFGVLAHDTLSQPFNWIARISSLETLNIIMGAITVVVATVVVWHTYRVLRLHPWRQTAVRFWLLTLVLFLVAYSILMPYKSEFMHFPQYALLGFLLVPLVGNFFATLCLGSILGFFDEAYQYIGLHKLYFDFNDIILNIIGTALGLMLAFLFKPFSKTTVVSPKISIWFWFSLLGVLSGLFLSGIIRFFADQGPWHWHRNIESAFVFELFIVQDHLAPWHLVTPYEGIILLALIPLLYWPMSRYTYDLKP